MGWSTGFDLGHLPAITGPGQDHAHGGCGGCGHAGGAPIGTGDRESAGVDDGIEHNPFGVFIRTPKVDAIAARVVSEEAVGITRAQNADGRTWAAIENGADLRAE